MFARGFKTWCEQVAIQQRKTLGLQSSDPLDPHLLAQKLNTLVWKVEEIPDFQQEYIDTLLIKDPESWSATTISNGNKNLVILNSSHQKVRQNSDLMHELSHIIIEHKPSFVDIPENGLMFLRSHNKQQEDEASWLSGCLLLPRDALFKVCIQSYSDTQIQNKYGVSSEMLQYRLNVTGVKKILKKW